MNNLETEINNILNDCYKGYGDFSPSEARVKLAKFVIQKQLDILMQVNINNFGSTMIELAAKLKKYEKSNL